MIKMNGLGLLRKNGKKIRKLRQRGFSIRIGTSEIFPAKLEFRLFLEREKNGEGNRYYASVKFPRYYAARIELGRENYRNCYEDILNRIKNGDYDIKLNRNGLLKMHIYPYV